MATKNYKPQIASNNHYQNFRNFSSVNIDGGTKFFNNITCSIRDFILKSNRNEVCSPVSPNWKSLIWNNLVIMDTQVFKLPASGSRGFSDTQILMTHIGNSRILESSCLISGINISSDGIRWKHPELQAIESQIFTGHYQWWPRWLLFFFSFWFSSINITNIKVFITNIFWFSRYFNLASMIPSVNSNTYTHSMDAEMKECHYVQVPATT